MVKPWHRLPREMNAPALETFKVKLNVALSNLIEMKHVPVPCRKVKLDDLWMCLLAQVFYESVNLWTFRSDII